MIRAAGLAGLVAVPVVLLAIVVASAQDTESSDQSAPGAVSYTHLTLPTNREV